MNLKIQASMTSFLVANIYFPEYLIDHTVRKGIFFFTRNDTYIQDDNKAGLN